MIRTAWSHGARILGTNSLTLASGALLVIAALALAFSPSLYDVTHHTGSSKRLKRARFLLTKSVAEEELVINRTLRVRDQPYADGVEDLKEGIDEVERSPEALLDQIASHGRAPSRADGLHALLGAMRGLYWWGLATVLASIAGLVSALALAIRPKWPRMPGGKRVEVTVAAAAALSLGAYLGFMVSVAGFRDGVAGAVGRSVPTSEGFTLWGVLACALYCGAAACGVLGVARSASARREGSSSSPERQATAPDEQVVADAFAGGVD